MIGRRKLLACAAALAGCGGRPDAAELLPETVAGNWRRTLRREVPAAVAPEPPARGTVRRVVRAEYEGPGKAEVVLYELGSSASALDAVQRFRHAADTVFFHRDEYFVVVRWQAAEREAVAEFVRGLEAAMARGGSGKAG